MHVFVCPVLSPDCKLSLERSLLTSVATDQAPESLLHIKIQSLSHGLHMAAVPYPNTMYETGFIYNN